MEVINKKCQVPTPESIVTEMLDEIGYVSSLQGKKVLENSCGEGNFILEIAKRYIIEGLKKHLSVEAIKKGLEQDITGYEIDQKLLITCIDNMNSLAQSYGIYGVRWNIAQKDALKENDEAKYDFVIGNPPYLSYSDLDIDTRQYLKKSFTSCHNGKPDYYYAFIEKGLKCLSETGKMAYLVPGNFMKNHFSLELRNLLLQSLYKLIDYSHEKLFEGILTSSVILLCNKEKASLKVIYENRSYKHRRTITKRNLEDKKWDFYHAQARNKRLVTFGDYFHASAPVATQLNQAFVIKQWEEDGNYIICNKAYKLEKEIVRDAAGPAAYAAGRKEKIIFPYILEDGNLIRISEKEFVTNYPGIAAYLSQFKSRLLNRCADNSASWFEYGRSQLLTHVDQNFILSSTFVTNRPCVYMVEKGHIPYAGICIMRKGIRSLKFAEAILRSDKFMQYVKSIGVCTNSGSYRISPRDINEFRFDLKEFGGEENENWF